MAIFLPRASEDCLVSSAKTSLMKFNWQDKENLMGAEQRNWEKWTSLQRKQVSKLPYRSRCWTPTHIFILYIYILLIYIHILRVTSCAHKMLSTIVSYAWGSFLQILFGDIWMTLDSVPLMRIFFHCQLAPLLAGL